MHTPIDRFVHIPLYSIGTMMTGPVSVRWTQQRPPLLLVRRFCYQQYGTRTTTALQCRHSTKVVIHHHIGFVQKSHMHSSFSSQHALRNKMTSLSLFSTRPRYRNYSTGIGLPVVRRWSRNSDHYRAVIRWCPSSVATMMGHAIFTLPICISLYRSNIQFSSLSSSDRPKIMATSPIVTLLPLQQKRSFWQRLRDWIIRCWRHCQDIAFITIRTTEVLLRFSPLLVLTPASLLYEQYIIHILSYRDDENNPIILEGSKLPVLLVVSKSKYGDDDYMSNATSSWNWVSDYTWMYIRSAITSLGPAFCKLGQWIATRRDIFPPNICDRLSVLHDRGVTHDGKYTHLALIDAFGTDYYEKGLQWNEHSPIIGSGSAAQVYAVTLVQKVNDELVPYPVAVKVLHPRMTERVERDLYFVQTIARWLHALPMERIKLLNLPRAVENFGNLLLRQTDLQIEADNLRQFRNNFYHNNEQNEHESAIFFPKPRDGWISRHVLVEDLVSDAIPISEYLKDSTVEGIEIRKELASPLLRAFLKMIFIDNFVHCDLHAGNVLIQTYTITDPLPPTTTFSSTVSWMASFFSNGHNNSNANTTSEMNHTPVLEIKRKIVFLDAGIAMSLNPNDQRNLHDLFRAVLLNDGNRAGRLMVERAHYERCSQIPGGVDAFAAGIEDLVSEFHTRRKDGLTLGAVRIGSLLSRVLDLCRIYGVEIDPNMSSIVISTLVLEGLGRSLEPELNLIDFAVPFVLGRGRV